MSDNVLKSSVLVLIALLGACSLPEPPSEMPAIRVVNITPESLGLNRQVFQLKLGLFNPNEAKIKVASGRLRLDLEDTVLGTGELVDGFSIAGGEEGEATLRIITDLMGKAPRLLQSLMASNGGLDYRVSGYLDVVGFGLGRIPIDERGRLGLPSRTEANTAEVL